MQLSLIVATHLGMNLAPKVVPCSHLPSFPQLVLETRDLSLARFLLRCLGTSVTIASKRMKDSPTFVSALYADNNNLMYGDK